VAARRGKIADRRKDCHRKQADGLVTRYALLAVEDLPIANTARRATPKPDPDNPQRFLPTGARAKSGLNRSISDAGWGQFVSRCGHAAPENRASQAAFACQRYGHRAPADEHPAANILRAGLALHAATAASGRSMIPEPMSPVRSNGGAGGADGGSRACNAVVGSPV